MAKYWWKYTPQIDWSVKVKTVTAIIHRINLIVNCYLQSICTLTLLPLAWEILSQAVQLVVDSNEFWLLMGPVLLVAKRAAIRQWALRRQHSRHLEMKLNILFLSISIEKISHNLNTREKFALHLFTWFSHFSQRRLMFIICAFACACWIVFFFGITCAGT